MKQYNFLILLLFLSSIVICQENEYWKEIKLEAFQNNTDKEDIRNGCILFSDSISGYIYINTWNQGVWVSRDQAKTFNRIDGGKISNTGCGPFGGNAAYITTDGNGIAIFDMNNKPGPSGYSKDGGKTWHSFTSVERNWDFGAMEFNTGTVVAARHEFNTIHASFDFGQTWQKINQPRNNLTGLAALDQKKLLLAYPNKILRSNDQAVSWEKISNYSPFGNSILHNGKWYWISVEGLLISEDNGETWQILGSRIPFTPRFGPFFGKKENNFMVVTKIGFYETLDGGENWNMVMPLPDKFNLGYDRQSATWDPINDIFYANNSFYYSPKYGSPEIKLLKAKRPNSTIKLSFDSIQKQNLKLKRISQKIQIDGELDDAYLISNQKLEFKNLYDEKQKLKDNTVAYIQYDKESLYMYFKCELSKETTKATITERDGELWRDDSIEIFLDPYNTRKQTYFHLVINSNGVTEDSIDKDCLSWNPKIEVKCNVKPNKFWAVEIKIPFSELYLDKNKIPRLWNVNFTRTSYDKDDHNIEESTWSSINEKWSHFPERFGTFIFE